MLFKENKDEQKSDRNYKSSAILQKERNMQTEPLGN